MPVVGREPSHVSFRVNTLHAVVSLPLGNQKLLYLVPESSSPTNNNNRGRLREEDSHPRATCS
jgi:hypothetical protein